MELSNNNLNFSRYFPKGNIDYVSNHVPIGEALYYSCFYRLYILFVSVGAHQASNQHGLTHADTRMNLYKQTQNRPSLQHRTQLQNSLEPNSQRTSFLENFIALFLPLSQQGGETTCKKNRQKNKQRYLTIFSTK